jgi:molybdopterin/thiamine biosynthesis adenylyltransferase/nitroreductase
MTSDLFAESDTAAFSARILDEDNAADREILKELRTDPRIEFVDRRAEQASCLRGLRPAAEPALLEEPTRWGYYPWRRSVVGLLGPGAYRRVRLDRNRNLITADEQARLGALRIGIIGLSVGHVIAHTLAAEGLCGQLRLADFDELELSNLNRVPATVFDLGANKAVLAARRIAELDPYLSVAVQTSGVTQDTLGEFLDGLDIVVEECDSLDMKAMVREAARALRLPVLMATSDRGLMDVERFDLEPTRPILHGLLGDVDWSLLTGLSMRDKVPYLLKCLEVAQSSPRAAASMVEVGNTLSSWPQLATDVTLGASAVAEAVRRIGLGQPLASGRVRADIAEALDHLEQPTIAAEPATEPEPATPEHSGPLDMVAAAAARAPSGGNTQPWLIETTAESMTIDIAPEYTSAMDVRFRASAVAVGAATFNARVAAAADGTSASVDFEADDQPSPLRATLRISAGRDESLARLYGPMLRRETNRAKGVPSAIPSATTTALESAARREGGRLAILAGRPEIDRAADIFASADRIRYLTPKLHSEMIAELRWPGDADPDAGIEVGTLGLPAADLAVLDILRRPDVMALLSNWDAGQSLGNDVRERVTASSAIATVLVCGSGLTDYAHGGSALEAVWIAAQEHGLAIQPVSPPFLYARSQNDLDDLSPAYAPELHTLQQTFHDLMGIAHDESPVLVLRLFYAPPASARSRRRPFRPVELALG